jgi:hypothetical protein
MGLGVGGLVLAGVMSTTVYTARTFVGIGNYCDLSANDRNSLDRMSQDIRQVNNLNSYTTNMLVFQTTDADTGSNYTLVYNYDTVAQTLTRALGTQTNVLLTNCSYYHFDLYQRNPTLTNGGELVTYNPSNSPSTVKAIDFTWICSRSVLGITHNSEDVQSARIVIRK